MSNNPGGVDLGSAYGRILIDTSQVSTQMQTALGQIERDFGASMTRVGASMQKMGRDLTLATAPISGFIVKGVLAFASLDDVLTEISARTGATATDMDKVRQVALQLGQDTKFSSVEAAQGILELLASGQSLKDAFATIPHVLNLAAAGNIQLADAASVVTTVLAQFKLPASEAENVVNALNAAAASSKAEVGDMAQAFENVGPIAANFGLSVEETAAALAVFAQNGIVGAEAGTQLKSMLTNMTRPTDDVQGMWKKLGISMFDAQGKMRPLNAIIVDLNKSMKNMTQKDRILTIQTLAGSYGQVGLSALLASGGISEMELQMANAATAAQVAEERSNSFNGIVEQLMGSIETLSINVIGPLVEKYLEPLIKKAIDVTNAINEWVLKNPELAEQLGIVAVLVAGLGPVLFTIGSIISGVGAAFGVMGVAVGALLSPIGLLIAAGALLYLAYTNNWLGIRDTINDAIAFILPILGMLYAWFVTDGLPFIEESIDNFLTNWGIFTTALSTAWNAIIEPELLKFATWFITGEFQKSQQAIDTFLVVWDKFTQLLTGAWMIILPQLTLMFGWFTVSGMPLVKGAIGQVIDQINLLIERANRIWDAISGTMGIFKTNFTQVFVDALKAVTDVKKAIDDLMLAFNAAKSIGGAVTGGLGAGIFGAARSALGFAAGGEYQAGKPRITGEAGMELDVPRSSGMVVANDQLKTAMKVLAGGMSSMAAAGVGGGSGGGVSIGNVNITVPEWKTDDPKEAGKQMGQGFALEIKELLRARG